MPWEMLNRNYLLSEFETLRRCLGGSEAEPARNVVPDGELRRMDPPAPIDALAAIFELSPFERALLLLLAGVEMDAALAAQCSEAGFRPQRGLVTFSLAMAALPDPHWSALAPFSPLRRFRLIEMESGHGLTSAPLHVNERILHYIAGVNQLDDRLDNMLLQKPKPEWMAEQHFRLAAEIMQRLEGGVPTSTVFHLCGDDAAAQENVAAMIAHYASRELFVLRMEDTPASVPEMDQFLQLWTRESLLLPALLLLQWESDAPNVGCPSTGGARARSVAHRQPRLHPAASRRRTL